MRLGAIGDVARTLPAASLVRAAYPGAHLAWLVEAAAASLVAGQPWIDEVIVFPRPGAGRQSASTRASLPALREFVSALRARRFELVIDFHSILRSALLALASGARRRIGYGPPFGRELAWAFATDRARIAPERVSRFERNEGLVRFLGIETPASVRPVHVDPASRDAMREQLGPGPAPVVMHPGTSVAAARKRLPPALFARVARELHRELAIPTLVSCGSSSEERRLAETVVREAPGAARLAPATPTLPELAALLASARLAIGPDTGPLHLAALVGTPVVLLLGATDPVENAPWPPTPSRPLRAQRAGDGSLSLAPEEIVAAARDLLGCDAVPDRSAGATP